MLYNHVKASSNKRIAPPKQPNRRMKYVKQKEMIAIGAVATLGFLAACESDSDDAPKKQLQKK